VTGEAAQRIIIRPVKERALLDLPEIWRFRQLLGILVWRTLKVRYQQTVVGVGWAILQPLLLTFVFTVIFGMLAKMPTDGKPYPLFVMAGLIVWQFVAQSFQSSSASVVANAHLVSRIYFPRIVLLTASIAAAFFDFLCTLLLLAIVMLWYGIAPSWGAVAFLPMLLLAVITTMGLSLWLAALYVPYRDVGHLLPFLTQLWMFLSPVIYPTALLPERFQYLYALNPLVVVIETSRWAFVGGNPPDVRMVAVSTIVALVLFVSGLWFFRRHEGTFADIV
jgi:lipopolysaccharide transport system permease protein